MRYRIVGCCPHDDNNVITAQSVVQELFRGGDNYVGAKSTYGRSRWASRSDGHSFRGCRTTDYDRVSIGRVATIDIDGCYTHEADR